MAYVGTRDECAKLQSIDDEVAGLPLRGTHVGGGVHVDLDASDPAHGGNGAGWTLHERDVLVHPAKAQYAYDVGDTPRDVEPADVATYDAAKAEDKPLPPDWSEKPKDKPADAGVERVR